MYLPKGNSFIKAFFSWYISYLIRKDFTSFQYNKIDFQSDQSVLLLANHFSWWDGFLIFQLNKLYFKKKFHVLVNEENHQKVSFLKYLGAFAPKGKGRDILRTLDYAGQLLNDANNLVLIFPQGKLHSNHLKEIHFEKGIMQIIHSSQQKMNIIFASTLIDYFSRRKPSAFCYLQHWKPEPYLNLQMLKNAYNKHYERSVVTQTKIVE